VRLLAVSWDGSDEKESDQAFSPLLVLELAYLDAPTIRFYYEKAGRQISYLDDIGFISDIADGLSVLHRCDVVHGDLKPENVLLFKDSARTGKLVAKLSDFGGSRITVTDGLRKNRSRCWDAPECLSKLGDSMVHNPDSISDVYSFSLVAMFIALGGRGPLDFKGLSEDDIHELKAKNKASAKIEENLRHYYADLEFQGMAEADTALRSYILLMQDTLKSSPTDRLASLDRIRRRLTKE
jgi:serine/threonine protein kinase